MFKTEFLHFVSNSANLFELINRSCCYFVTFNIAVLHRMIVLIFV